MNATYIFFPKVIYKFMEYRISSNTRPQRLLDFETVGCGAY